MSETVQKTEWTKSLSEVKVPFTANLQIIFTKKEEFTPKKESYDMASWQYINYTTSNGKYDLGQEKESEVEVEKGDIDTHLKLLNETSKHVKRNQIKNEEKYTFRLNTKGTDTQLVRTDGKKRWKTATSVRRTFFH